MRRQLRKYGIWAIAALGAVLLWHTGAAPAAVTKTAAPQVGVMLSIDKSGYAVGPTQPVQLHAALTLFNHSDVPMRFAERGHAYDWQIVDSQGQTVWDYAHGRMFPMFIRMRVLTQGQLDYPQDIPLQMQDGTPLAPGRYTLRGTLTGVGDSASVGFTVVAADAPN